MYHITLLEEGRFCSHIGGPLLTLAEAIKQMRKVASGLKAEELHGYYGYKFDRADTICALLITDRWQMPVKNVQEEEN